MKISQILDKIDENQLFIPAFQREYVWKRDDAKNLIYSLIKDYPTGTMLTWETNNPPELKGKHKYEPSMFLSGITKTLENGGYDFQSSAPQREVNAALINLGGVLKTKYGYQAADADETLAFFLELAKKSEASAQ